MNSRHSRAISRRRLDVLTGRRFGRLAVGARAANDRQGKPMWHCLCDCGSQTIVRSIALRNGSSQSCGCLARELTRTRSITHGRTSTREWETWHRMKQRCYDPGIDGYMRYGGRGIQVCDRWRDSFEIFYSDMGDRPGPGYSIERVNNDGDYCPENCKWATAGEQARNRSTTVMITAEGRTMTAAEWARELNMSQTTISERISRGWTPARAVSEPVIRKQRKWQKTG